MKPHELRAARQLLGKSQSDVAEASSVSLATVKRFEAGSSVSGPYVAAMRRGVEAMGAMIVDAGVEVAGRRASGGVVVVDGAARPDGAAAG